MFIFRRLNQRLVLLTKALFHQLLELFTIGVDRAADNVIAAEPRWNVLFIDVLANKGALALSRRPKQHNRLLYL